MKTHEKLIEDSLDEMFVISRQARELADRMRKVTDQVYAALRAKDLEKEEELFLERADTIDSQNAT